MYIFQCRNWLKIAGGSCKSLLQHTICNHWMTLCRSSVMPQSHCPESTPEQGQMDNSSWFKGSFLVIPGHSSNDNDNDNRFEQRSSRACSLGRPVRSLHVQQVCVPSMNNLHSCLCALRMCSYHVSSITYFLYSSWFSLYAMLFVHVHFRQTEYECDSIEKRIELSSYYFRTIHERFENDSHYHSHW